MRVRLAIVLALTGACLIWVLRGIELDQVAISLGDANWLWVASVYPVYLLNHCIRTLRLRILLDRPVPFGDLFAITAVGFLAINVVPLRLGEFVRPYLLLERHKIPFGTSLAAIFVERLLDLIMLISALTLTAAVVDLPPQGIVVGDIDVVTAGQNVVGATLTLGLIGLVVLMVVGKPVVQLIGRIPALGPRLGGFLQAFYEGLWGLFRRPGQALMTVLLSLTMWTGIVFATTACLHGFEGVPHTLQAGLTTWTLTLTGMVVAPTPGFFGSYEAFCQAALMLFETDRSVAATFAVVLHLTQFTFIVGLGGLYLLREGLSLREVVSQSRALAAEAHND